MQQQYLDNQFNFRRARLLCIRASAGEFKVCSACLSIALNRARVCPVCGAYRFFYSPEAVRAVALFMHAAPWPRTAGTVPRLGGFQQQEQQSQGVEYEVLNGN